MSGKPTTLRFGALRFTWAEDDNTHDDDLKMDVSIGTVPVFITKGQARELFSWLGAMLHR